jgi:hypothetical protein
MQLSTSSIRLLGFAGLLVLILAILVWANLLYVWSGPSKPPVEQSERLQIQTIVTQIKALVEEQGVPKDIDSLPSELFGSNPRSEVYLNKGAFKLDSSGRICDSSGTPYVIAVGNGVISVTSSHYSISSTANYVEK